MKNKNKNKEDNFLSFLYSNLEKSFWKRFILRICISKTLNKASTLYLKSFVSKIHIKKIVKKNNIDLNLFEKNKFKSYNDFFIRKYKNISFVKDNDCFISPCEGKIMTFYINDNSVFSIKGVNYHLSDLLKNSSLASEYNEGYLILLRLRPVDYHRYIFVDDGVQKKENICRIKGKLHTVNPISFKYYNVFAENSREYCILETKNFGKIVQVEIGALLVGKINNFPIQEFNKGQEKGFFSFGGSTIVLLLKKNKLIIEKEFLENSKKNIETDISLGQKIGIKKHI
ncbi:phosphatidylserine decarboxylase [Candidatus Phytoplasma luffae]|uniref:Phosphatidylserine decarboxylase n=1 Tax=Loofah witches'-broom phytoplasma TaxID=35773 RepID=A0A975IM64_LOWBP|nr:phosphatidylserine decarboxylase [Candidatus Phytoplasma luffae]QTX03098.1 phosphatidylserine decarboxylase [Candidatus Phytoplasma luffae]